MIADVESEEAEKKGERMRVLIVDGLGAGFHRAMAEALAKRNIDVVTAEEMQMEMRDPIIPEIEMLRECDKRVKVREKSYNRSMPVHQQKQARYRRQNRGRR